MTTGDRIDVLIIGSGLGGCAAALSAARAGAHVVMLTKGVRAEDSNTWEAQGGIIYRGVNDSPERLAADIVAAGAGLCYPEAVELLSREGPRLVEEVLVSHAGVPFDRAPDGTLDLTAEAAHSLPRIVHHKDDTGRAIEEAMLAAVRREPNATVLCGQTAIDLLSLSHHSRNPLDIYAEPTCVGAYVFDHASGRVQSLLAKETILATGGLGRILSQRGLVEEHDGRASDEAGGEVELLMLEEGNHGCANVAPWHRPYTADWMAARLRAER